MKKLTSLISALLLCLALAVPAFADADQCLVYDNEGLLSDTEIAELESALQDICLEYDVDAAIVTTASLDGKSAEAYADDFYDNNSLGSGADNDGILLLISANERQWAVSTSGYGIYAFTDDIIDSMADEFVPYMSDGEWFCACESFTDNCALYLGYAGDDNYQFNEDDFDNYYDDNYELISSRPSGFQPMWLLMAIVIGLIAAFIAMSVMKSGMKSVKMQSAAADYVRAGSFELKGSHDLFLYHTVTRTARPKDNDNNGGSHHGGFGSGGGFSSTHMSSGGAMHGGRSGRF